MSDFCDPMVSGARQAPLSMGLHRQEHWSGLPFPSPRDLPDPGMEPASLASSALAGGFLATESPRKSRHSLVFSLKNCNTCEKITLRRMRRYANRKSICRIAN